MTINPRQWLSWQMQFGSIVLLAAVLLAALVATPVVVIALALRVGKLLGQRRG